MQEHIQCAKCNCQVRVFFFFFFKLQRKETQVTTSDRRFNIRMGVFSNIRKEMVGLVCGPGPWQLWESWPKAQPSCNVREGKLEVGTRPKGWEGREKYTKMDPLFDHFLYTSHFLCYLFIIALTSSHIIIKMVGKGSLFEKNLGGRDCSVCSSIFPVLVDLYLSVLPLI